MESQCRGKKEKKEKGIRRTFAEPSVGSAVCLSAGCRAVLRNERGKRELENNRQGMTSRYVAFFNPPRLSFRHVEKNIFGAKSFAKLFTGWVPSVGRRSREQL